MIIKNCIDTTILLAEVEIERKRFLKDTFCKCLMLLFSIYLLYYMIQIQKAMVLWLFSGIIVLYYLCWIIFNCQRLFTYYHRKKNGADIIQLSRSFLSIDKSIDNRIMTLNEKEILDYQLFLNAKGFLDVTLKDGESRRIPLTDVYFAPEDHDYMLFIEQTGIGLMAPASACKLDKEFWNLKGDVHEHRK